MDQKGFLKMDLFRIAGSVVCLYLLAPSLDRRVGFLVSLAFALLNIFAARILIDKNHVVRAGSYVGIALGTYYILFSDQPWEFLHHGGVWDASALPLVVCSVIMSLAGWILLKDWKARVLYALITLGIQIPVGLFVGGSAIQGLFEDLARVFRYETFHLDALVVWQFEWMLTYHLPFYFLADRHQNPRDSK